jgi:hypothetical protein
MLLQVISVLGALMVLSAYGLIQGGVWRELNAGYLASNIVGSLLLGIVAIADQQVGFIFLEFAWACLGLVGLARAVKARHTASQHGSNERTTHMAGLILAGEVFEKAQNAAAAATGLDEKAMQIDYPALKEKIRAALGDRKVALCQQVDVETLRRFSASPRVSSSIRSVATLPC